MKKLLILLTVALGGIFLTSCEYDDTDLWNEVEQIKDRVATLEETVQKTNGNLSALQTIVESLQQNVYVTHVETTTDGYTIKFSNGTTATISNGKDGINAPIVSVKQDQDSLYYWTLDDEWLLVNNQKVCATGKDAMAPQVRINEYTKEWEISTDNGKTWSSTGVVAEGKDGKDETTFKSVNTSNEKFVLITLADETELKLARYDESMPLFVIAEVPEITQVEYGKSVEYAVDVKHVADYTIYTPVGWKVVFEENLLTITAPTKDLCHFDKEGSIAIVVVSEAGKSAIVKLQVMAGEWVEGTVLRTLTFEDTDTKFTPYQLDYFNNKQIAKWSDLIAEDQYGDYILGYGAWMGDCVPTDDSHYGWYDENNTCLAHDFPCNYDSYCLAGGGHAISNYASNDYSGHGNYMYQLTVYDKDANGLVRKGGGHNGSNHFAIHYGYYDGSPWNSTTEDNLPAIYFKDEKARIIDHLWVTLTTYEYYCLHEGNGLTAPLGSGDYVIIEAIGHREDGTTTKISIKVADLQSGVVDQWTKWDLSALGKVKKVHFNIIGTNDNGYGFSQPAYFAYDDVAVQFEGQVFK